MLGNDTSKHHPNGGACPHWDNAKIESLIAAYQTHGDVKSLAAIVELTKERALTLIRFRKTSRYRAEDELLSDVNFKLMRAVAHFDPQKGSAFTFVSQVVTNVLCTSVSNVRKGAHRYTKLTRAIARKVPDKSEDRSGVDDITHRIKTGARTSLREVRELAAQRWFIESFTSDGFESRRHECANAAMGVFQQNHTRSRELYDLTMLEVRRLLYDDVNRRPQIAPGRLIGTRSAWMTRYAPLLSADEFTKFVVLMRDLAPYLLLIIVPENGCSHRRDRSEAIGRKNLELVLYGDPDAVKLF
jgi:hypothetical protein